MIPDMGDDKPTLMELAVAAADVRRARAMRQPIPPAALDVYRRANLALPPPVTGPSPE